MSQIENQKSKIEKPFIETGPATAILPARQSNLTPITVIGTEKIRNGFDAMCITQALNSREAPGVERLVLNPDAHCGYGAPIGCVLVSRATLSGLSRPGTSDRGRRSVC